MKSMLRSVRFVETDVSKELAATIFGVNEFRSEETRQYLVTLKLFFSHGFFNPEDGSEMFLRNACA
jgi:hypothetical protein